MINTIMNSDTRMVSIKIKNESSAFINAFITRIFSRCSSHGLKFQFSLSTILFSDCRSSLTINIELIIVETD